MKVIIKIISFSHVYERLDRIFRMFTKMLGSVDGLNVGRTCMLCVVHGGLFIKYIYRSEHNGDVSLKDNIKSSLLIH